MGGGNYEDISTHSVCSKLPPPPLAEADSGSGSGTQIESMVAIEHAQSDDQSILQQEDRRYMLLYSKSKASRAVLFFRNVVQADAHGLVHLLYRYTYTLLHMRETIFPVSLPLSARTPSSQNTTSPGSPRACSSSAVKKNGTSSTKLKLLRQKRTTTLFWSICRRDTASHTPSPYQSLQSTVFWFILLHSPLGVSTTIPKLRDVY